MRLANVTDEHVILIHYERVSRQGELVEGVESRTRFRYQSHRHHVEERSSQKFVVLAAEQQSRFRVIRSAHVQN